MSKPTQKNNRAARKGISAKVERPKRKTGSVRRTPKIGDIVEYYHDIIHSSPYGHLILRDGAIVVANFTFAKMLGYKSVDEFHSKKFSTLLSEKAQKTFQLMMRRLGRGESVAQHFELELLRRNGTNVDIETSITPCELDGKPSFALHCSDVTERKVLQRRLMDSESLFRNVVNSMGDALVITDLHGKVLDVNHEFERLTGFMRAEAVGKEIPHPWVGEVNLKDYMAWLEKLRQDGTLRDFDITWISRDGKKIAVSLNTTMLRSPLGDLAAMANVARDITERRTAQTELSNQVKRLEVLYELGRKLTGSLDFREIARISFQQVSKVIPLHAFFLDLYDEERRQLRSLLQYDSQAEGNGELVTSDAPSPIEESPACARVITSRKSFLELRADEHVEEYYKPFGNVDSQSRSLMFVPMFSKERIIGIISAQSYDENRYTHEHVTILESIASVSAIALEKAKLHHETVAKSLEIEARNKELDDFTYVVSHDLKEPLISVEGYAKILKREYGEKLDGDARQYVQSIIESCGNMKKLIEDLLQLSRVSKVQEHRVPLNLRVLLDQVLAEFEFALRDRNVDIRVGAELPTVMGVEPHVKIVFRNLISNAIKFSDKSNPVVEIDGEAIQGEARLFVRDNGIGIESKYFDKIFMIFQRLNKDVEGTGAGLTMVKKIIESHGGKIWVESKPSQGTTFLFTLPLA